MKWLWRSFLYFLALVGASVLLILAGLYILRRPLSERVLNTALESYQVEVRRLGVDVIGTEAFGLQPMELVWKGQQVKLGRVVLERRASGEPGLGNLRMESLELRLDGNAWLKAAQLEAQSKPAEAEVPGSPAPMPQFESLSLDGKVELGVPGLKEPLAFELVAQPGAEGRNMAVQWTLSGNTLQATGEALEDLAAGSGTVRIKKLDTTFEAWKPLLAPFMPSSLAGWDLSGQLSVEGDLHHGAGPFGGRSLVHVRAGRALCTADGIEATGVELDLQLEDVVAMTSAPGQRLFVRSLKVAGILIEDLELKFQILGPELLVVEALQMRALGGRVSVAPLRLNPAGPDYFGTLELTKVDVAQVMKFFPDAKADATGSVDGVVPLGFGQKGLRYGRGWLALSAGTQASLRLNQPGLLSSGMAKDGTVYPLLKSLEEGRRTIQLKTLRADLFEVEEGTGRSVLLKLSGDTVQGEERSPVSLQINVNGPLAALIRWGMDSRVNVGVH